jgi:glycogen(starch) synthase
METIANGLVNFHPSEPPARPKAPAQREAANGSSPPHRSPDAEVLRRVAWEIGERRPADAFTPPANHLGLAAVSPAEGFAHWRILPAWVEQTAHARGDRWHHCRLVLRLYDVSYITFTGLNANQVQDRPLPALDGQTFFRLPRPGTWQLAEVGFVLRDGEFLPAARSHAVHFPPDAAASCGSQAALLVNGGGRVEEIGNVWEQEKILRELRRPRLRQPLRIAVLTCASAPFVAELTAGQCAAGHEVHVLAPAADGFTTARQEAGVHYHPLDLGGDGPPVEKAQAFARAAREQLAELPPLDLIHCHEWMAALAPGLGDRPSVLSLGSVEATRRNGSPVAPLSQAIAEAERAAAQSVRCVLTPDWLRDRAVAELGLDPGRVRAFPLEGRLPNEWECPLDFGHVKMGIGLGPLDRLILFVGPLEHAAGVDLLLEALPVLLQRAPNLRLACAGSGHLHGQLEGRAGQLGVAHAVRLLGHVDGPQVTRLLRAAEALVLPSRYRVPLDDAVVDLARRAGRPVVTTHGGPAHLVRHEENGIITYDNPGSMVWAVDRILGDMAHAERMGQNGRRTGDGSALQWCEVTRHYLELCATCFPELSETRI